MVYVNSKEKKEKKPRLTKRLKIIGVRCPSEQLVVNKAKGTFKLLEVTGVDEQDVDKATGKPKYYNLRISGGMGEIVDLNEPEYALVRKLDDMTREKKHPMMDVVFYQTDRVAVVKGEKRIFTDCKVNTKSDLPMWKFI